MKLLLVIFTCSVLCIRANGQDNNFTPEEWAKKLSNPNDKENKATRDLMNVADPPSDNGRNSQDKIDKDNLQKCQQLIPLIAAAGDTNDLYFISRIKCTKTSLMARENSIDPSSSSHKEEVKRLMREAMNAAHETNDEYLEAFIGREYFARMKYYDETALAVMYGIYSTELYEKNFGVSQFPRYEFLGELMYRIKEYDKSIDYCKKWLSLGSQHERDPLQTMKLFTLNTMALAYQRKASYDSALYYYNKASDAAIESKRYDWVGIISGNMGQVYYLEQQYDTALTYLEKDYDTSISYKYFDNAANSLQWIARTNAALGNKEKALHQLREAMELIKKTPDAGYQQNIYYAAIDIYKQNGWNDSSFYYYSLYQKIHDTLEKKINLSSMAISKTRLNEEKNIYNIRRLQLEKRSQIQQRNFIIAGIVLLFLISILFINRQRLKSKHKQQKLEQQNKLIEQEISSAKKQMAMFTYSIIEKTSLIEKLEQQAQQKQSSVIEQEMIGNLSNLTILTEDDWEKFKQLFEKIYPLFFQKLKSKAHDITLAEQRMAALTRLQLTTRQMASMQGVSPDTVHKTRQRLRQRLGVSNETNLEEYFACI